MGWRALSSAARRALRAATEEAAMGTTGRRALCALALILCADAARAEEVSSAPKPGTFMMFEADFGYGVGAAFAENPGGLATGLTFGVGGKPKGWPLRFFGIARVGWGFLEGTVDAGVEHAVLERSVFNWGFGLRVIAPIANRFRLWVDTTLGGLQGESTATLAGGAERIASNDGSFLVEFGVGLQYRIHLNFSIGVRMDIAIPTGLESFDPMVETAGLSSDEAGLANLDWTLNATLHF